MLIGLLEKARDPLFNEAIKADSEDVNEIETNLKGNFVEKNTMSIKVEDSAHDEKNAESDNEIEVYYSKDIKRNKLNHQLAQKKKASDCMVKGENEVDEQTLKYIRREMQYGYDIEMARAHSLIEQGTPKKKRTRTEPIRLIETQSQKVVGDSRTARMHSLQNGTLYESTFSSSLPNNSSSKSSDDEESCNDESGDCQSSDDKANPKFDDSSSDSEASADDKAMVNPRFDDSSSNSNSSDESMIDSRFDGSRSNSDSSGSQSSDDEAKNDDSSDEASSHSRIDEQSSDDEDSCEDSNTSDDSSDKREHSQASDINMKQPSQVYIENFIDEAFAMTKRIRKAPPRFIEEQTLGGYCSPKASTNLESTKKKERKNRVGTKLKKRFKSKGFSPSDVRSKAAKTTKCSAWGGDNGDGKCVPKKRKYNQDEANEASTQKKIIVSSKEVILKSYAYSKESKMNASDAKSISKHKQEKTISNHEIYGYNRFIRSKQILQGGRACSKCKVVHLRNEYTRKQRELGTKRICRQCQGAGASSSKFR